MVHTGAQIPGEFPRMEGGGDTARYMRFPDMESVEELRDELISVVQAWTQLKDG